MNQRTAFPLKTGLLIAGIVVFVSVMFSQSHGADLKRHNERMEKVQQLKQSDVLLNQDLLKLRFGLVSNFDSIRSHMQNLYASLAKLRSEQSSVTGESLTQIDSRLARLDQLFKEKEASIEEFSENNATLNNSLRYFPTLTMRLVNWVKSQPASESGQRLDLSLNELLSKVLVYNLNASGELKPEIERLLEKLAGNAAELPQSAKTDLQLTANHAKTILQEKERVDELLKQLMAMETGTEIDGLGADFRAFQTGIERQAGYYRFGLFGMSLMLVGATVFILLRLREAGRALEAANATLEKRVAERTDELSLVNEQLKQDQATLLEYSKRVEDSNKELDDFTYTVSHDLKEPLRSLDAFAKFLFDDYAEKLDEEAKNYIERIRANSQYMKKLVEDLLEVSRVTKRPNELEPVAIAKLVDDLRLRFEAAMQQKHVQLMVDADLPTVVCDRVRITEVIANLISNGIKYSDKPECIISVGCEEAEGAWKFHVRDNGPGIDKQYFDKIFEMFQRLGKKEEHEGTGIGLTIVKKIIEKHKGRIWLESTLGQGTTFYFTIPKVDMPASP